MNETNDPASWEVVVATKLHDPGNAADGADERSIIRGTEEEARRAFHDTTGHAGEERYEYVRLRHNGQDVEYWPQATGWTV
jgi:hypothetical protein